MAVGLLLLVNTTSSVASVHEPFETVHLIACNLLGCHLSPGYTSEVLHDYFDHCVIKIKTATHCSNAFRLGWNRKMFLELATHALSALMLRESMGVVPNDHMPQPEDTKYISTVWDIIKNVYARDDTIPTVEEYRMLCEAIPSY